MTDKVNGAIVDFDLKDKLIAGEAVGEQMYWSHAQWSYRLTSGDGAIPLAGFNEAITYADKWLASH